MQPADVPWAKGLTMKRFLTLAAAATLVASSVGCCLTGHGKRSVQPGCEDGQCAAAAVPQQAPSMGQVAYPYYTIRGPRDFLQQF